MSPQRKLVTSDFGKALIAEIGRPNKGNNLLDNVFKKRTAVNHRDFGLTLLGLNRSENVVNKLQATISLLKVGPQQKKP